MVQITFASINQRVTLASVIVILLGVYLLVLPPVLGNQYRSAARPNADRVFAKMNEVSGTFGQEVFTHDRLNALPDEAGRDVINQAYQADRTELDRSAQTIRDAQAALDEEGEKLSGFITFPLMTWRQSYARARDAGRNADEYLSLARKHLTDYEALVTYAQKSGEISHQATLVSIALAENQSEDIGGIANAVDDAATKIDASLTQFKALDPPEYLRTDYQTDVADGDALVALLRRMASAIRNLDLATLDQLSTQLEQEDAQAETESRQFFQRLQNDSVLRKNISDLKRQQRAISDQLR